MTAPIATGRPVAQQLLTDRCVITTVDPEAEDWDPDTGFATDTTEIYDGPCLLLAPRIGQGRSRTGGDDKIIPTRVLCLPVDAPTVTVGDHITVTGHPNAFIVDDDGQRTNQVLQRIRVISEVDAEQVPT